MTPWLKRKKPLAGPPMPPSVDINILAAAIEEATRRGTLTAAEAYIAVKRPIQELDEWGEPLPLSSMQQDFLDRIFAILHKPMERGRALLYSGRLAPDEVDALVTVYFDVWEILVGDASDDMRASKPPFPAWAEATLGVLFQKPAAVVYNPPKDKPMNAPGKVKPPEPTQADRREIAVREQR